jgi:hypothetical protein
MARRGVQGRKLNRKILAHILTVGRRNEWRGKQRRSGAGIGGSIRRVRAADADRQRFDGGVEHAIAGPDAGLADLAEPGVGRPGQTDARREIQISGGASVRGTPGSVGNRMPAGAPGKTTDCRPGSNVAI